MDTQMLCGPNSLDYLRVVSYFCEWLWKFCFQGYCLFIMKLVFSRCQQTRCRKLSQQMKWKTYFTGKFASTGLLKELMYGDTTMGIKLNTYDVKGYMQSVKGLGSVGVVCVRVCFLKQWNNDYQHLTFIFLFRSLEVNSRQPISGSDHIRFRSARIVSPTLETTIWDSSVCFPMRYPHSSWLMYQRIRLKVISCSNVVETGWDWRRTTKYLFLYLGF